MQRLNLNIRSAPARPLRPPEQTPIEHGVPDGCAQDAAERKQDFKKTAAIGLIGKKVYLAGNGLYTAATKGEKHKFDQETESNLQEESIITFGFETFLSNCLYFNQR